MRTYFCITNDKGQTIPTLHANGQSLRLSHQEFFRLMCEAAWVAEVMAREALMTKENDNDCV